MRRRPKTPGARFVAFNISLAILISCLTSGLIRGMLRAATTNANGQNWFAVSLVPWVLLLGALGCVAVLAEVWVRAYRRRQDPRLCRGCFYDLSGLPAAGVCPECGRAYERQPS